MQLDSQSVTAAQAIEIALGHHRAGRLPEAVGIYRQVLEAEPQNAEALHLLGVAAHQRGAHQHAAELIERADRLAPGRPEILLNLGAALRALGRVAEAERCYRAALGIAPGFALARSNLGMLLRSLGRLEEAAQCLREGLDPASADAHANLGVVLQELGRLEEAEQLLRRALELSAGNADLHYNLGNVLHARKRADEAMTCYRRALELRPGFALALNNLGIVLREQRRLGEAEQALREAVAVDPQCVEAHYNLGSVLHALRRNAEAEACYRRALQPKPAYADAHNELGKLLNDMQRPEEAERCLREALALEPDHADAHNNLGVVLQVLGRPDEAQRSLLRALELRPDFAHVHSNLGVLLHVERRLDEAEGYLRRAVALRPGYAEAHNNLGVVLKDLGRSGEAEQCFRRALELKPAYAGAMSNLAEAQKDSGRAEEAIATYRRALALEPDNAWLHSNLLLTLSYRPGVTLAELAEAHAEFERRHALPLRSTWAPHANTPDPERPLRLGFVSADLGMHPIGYLMADVLAQLDRRRFAAFAYSNRRLKDAQTQRLVQNVEHWRDVAHLDDEALATQIRADGIDVLFDLSGHTGQNRLLVFARRPAPLQVTWMGYAGTTGLSAIDYLLTDADLVPPEFDRHYVETIVRLPATPSCYRLPEELPEVGPLPALRNTFVTFGSFNNPAKISPPTVALWGRILTQVPGSRLVLKYLGFDDPACRERFSRLFTEAGVDPSRLSFLGHTPLAEMFARYNEVDIALDPFPYTGGTTTLLALAMGVPVVTVNGEAMPHRQSAGILRKLGLAELVAISTASYFSQAVALAGDTSKVSVLRSELRGRLLATAIFDAKGFVRTLESVVRDLWKQWCLDPKRRR